MSVGTAVRISIMSCLTVKWMGDRARWPVISRCTHSRPINQTPPVRTFAIDRAEAGQSTIDDLARRQRARNVLREETVKRPYACVVAHFTLAQHPEFHARLIEYRAESHQRVVALGSEQRQYR